MTTNQEIDVSFLHPTESDQRLEATISADATPRFLIDALVKERFMPVPATGSRYGLRNTANGNTLLPDVPLADAKVVSPAVLKVDPQYSGALEV